LDEMRKLLRNSFDPRDRAIMLTLAKTGVRAGEFLAIEVNDVNWKDWSIRLKQNNKRSNSTVFFDGETAEILKRWLMIREFYVSNGEKSLFVTRYGKRMSHNTLGNIVKRHAKFVDLHDDESHDLQRRFTPHCFRHWFTTALRKAGMPREHVQELRGDTRTDTMDIYYHISPEELRESYLKYMPTLGV